MITELIIFKYFFIFTLLMPLFILEFHIKIKGIVKSVDKNRKTPLLSLGVFVLMYPACGSRCSSLSFLTKRPRRNKRLFFLVHRTRKVSYSHSTTRLLSALFYGVFSYLSYHYYHGIPPQKREYQFL